MKASTAVEDLLKETGFRDTPPVDPQETEVERAKRLMEEAADTMDEGRCSDPLTDGLRDCASKLLAEDQYEAVVTVLTRMSGKPARQVRRTLKTKLGVTA